jgi:hypothetical protein
MAWRPKERHGLKGDFLKLYAEFPHWTAPKFAGVLKTTPEYIRATARRNNIKLNPSHRWKSR